MYRIPILLLFLLLPPHLPAQGDDYDVSQLTFVESLSLEDEIERGFGRYDTFEFEAGSGDRVLISIQANLFRPTLLLVSPGDSTFVLPQSRYARQVSHDLVLPEGGVWLLIVRGDSLALGPYEVNCRRVAANSLTIEEDADICQQLNYLTAHSNADFVFMENPAIAGSPNTREPSLIIQNAIHARLSDETDRIYQATLYQGKDRTRAETLYQSMTARINFCAGAGWKLETKFYHLPFGARYKQKYVQARERDRDDFRYVRVLLNDYSNTPGNHPYDLEVQLVVARHRPLPTP